MRYLVRNAFLRSVNVPSNIHNLIIAAPCPTQQLNLHKVLLITCSSELGFPLFFRLSCPQLNHPSAIHQPSINHPCCGFSIGIRCCRTYALLHSKPWNRTCVPPTRTWFCAHPIAKRLDPGILPLLHCLLFPFSGCRILVVT